MSCPPVSSEMSMKDDTKARLVKLLSHSGYIPDR